MAGQPGVKTNAKATDGNATLRMMKFVAANRTNAMAAGVTETILCESGSLTADITQKSADTYSAGDTLAVTSNNCLIGGDRIFGSFTLAVSSVSGTAFSETSAYGLTLAANYSGFGIQFSDNSSAAITGGLTLTFSEDPTQNTYAISAKGRLLQGSASFQGAPAEAVSIANYTIALNGDAAKDVITYNGDVFGKSSALGDYSYRVGTLAPFATLASDFYPSSGKATITGSNATITITAIDSNTVRIEYTDASGTKTQTKTWDEFDA